MLYAVSLCDEAACMYDGDDKLLLWTDVLLCYLLMGCCESIAEIDALVCLIQLWCVWLCGEWKENKLMTVV